MEVPVAMGQPADAIVRVAQEPSAGLVVMSAHGRTGLQHVLLGSVAEKVVRLAPCPVLTIKHRRAPHSPLGLGVSALRAPLGPDPAPAGRPLIRPRQRFSLSRWALVGPREGPSGLVRLDHGGGVPALGTDLATTGRAVITLVITGRRVLAVDTHQSRRPRPFHISRKTADIREGAFLGPTSGDLRRATIGRDASLSPCSAQLAHGAAHDQRGSKICSGLTVIAFPHQLSVWAAAMSARETRGFEPSRLFRSEKTPC
jgi:hypothetical protein